MTKTDTASSFDLSSLSEARKPFEHELVHPGTKRGIGLFLQLISVNEPGPKKVVARVNAASQKLARKNQSFTAEQQRDNAIDILFACTTSWRWGTDADGKPASWKGTTPELSAQSFRDVFMIDELREQIDAEVGDNTNFF